MPAHLSSFFARFSAGRAVRWLSILATLAMLALLAWLGAGIFWSLTTRPTPEPAVAIETDPSRAAQRIAAHHLFGEAPARPAAAAKARELSDIQLRGVIAATRPGQPAVAVLAIAGKAPVSVREGEEVMPGVTVHRVLARQVELKRDGNVEALALPERQSVAAPPGKPAPQPPETERSPRRRSS